MTKSIQYEDEIDIQPLMELNNENLDYNETKIIFDNKKLKTIKEWKNCLPKKIHKCLSKEQINAPGLLNKILLSLAENFGNFDYSELIELHAYIEYVYVKKICKKILKADKNQANIDYFTRNNGLVKFDIDTYENLSFLNKSEHVFVFREIIFEYLHGIKNCHECDKDLTKYKRNAYSQDEIKAMDKFINDLYIPDKYCDPITSEILHNPVILEIPHAIGLTFNDINIMKKLYSNGMDIHFNHFLITYKPDFITKIKNENVITNITMNLSTYDRLFRDYGNGLNDFNMHIKIECKTNILLINEFKSFLYFLGFEANIDFYDYYTGNLMSNPVSVRDNPPYYEYNTIHTVLKVPTQHNTLYRYYIYNPINNHKVFLDKYVPNSILKNKIDNFRRKCNKMSAVMHFMKK